MSQRLIQSGGTASVILIAVLASGSFHARAGERAELLLTGGRIIDGTGAPWYLGDIAVRQGKVAAIGRLDTLSADRVVDVSGLSIAPGFIDMLGQTGAPFLKNPRAADNLLRQGITTLNAGEGDSDAPRDARGRDGRLEHHGRVHHRS